MERLFEANKELNKKLLNSDTEELISYLHDVYTNKPLQQEAIMWIDKIENKPADELRKIVLEEGETTFYKAWPTKKWTTYFYFINRLGIVILLRAEKNQEEYIYKKEDENITCWFLPIDNQGNIKGKEFYENLPDNKKEKFPVLGDFAIYTLVKECKLYKEKEEEIKKKYKNENLVPHHLVYIQKNDARDNRIDNIICLPEKIHKMFNHQP